MGIADQGVDIFTKLSAFKSMLGDSEMPNFKDLIPDVGDIGDFLMDKNSNKIKVNKINKFLADKKPNPKGSLKDNFNFAFKALSTFKNYKIEPNDIELSVLDRTLKNHRKFKRFLVNEITDLIKR